MNADFGFFTNWKIVPNRAGLASTETFEELTVSKGETDKESLA